MDMDKINKKAEREKHSNALHEYILCETNKDMLCSICSSNLNERS